ncbi:MAG TPA: signal recognition particle-docking protein FtsY [Candidatus Nanopelagicaceae bacterium]|jgi:fused signal recognition particle receptor|nr:signal recognition particle-docking protein FtsY [Candidatus Nanopelagicaceae bacterium]
MGLFGSFLSKFSKSKATIEDLEQFRQILISSDIGVGITEEILDLVKREKSEELSTAIASSLKSKLTTSSRVINLSSDGPTVILIVGVNGTGKTTSAAKLANYYAKSGKKVLLVAADTFRAAAVAQLQTWGQRIGVEVLSASSNSDPAAIAFDGAKKAKDEGFDFLIIDTAGRLHTKSNLMDELGKIQRVVEKVTLVNEILFVLDGTTGQNGIKQAETFAASVNLTGIVVTKLDGSTKGGIAIATEAALQVPLKYVGFGEGIEDLTPFEADGYIAELLT